HPRDDVDGVRLRTDAVPAHRLAHRPASVCAGHMLASARRHTRISAVETSAPVPGSDTRQDVHAPHGSGASSSSTGSAAAGRFTGPPVTTPLLRRVVLR